MSDRSVLDALPDAVVSAVAVGLGVPVDELVGESVGGGEHWAPAVAAAVAYQCATAGDEHQADRRALVDLAHALEVAQAGGATVVRVDDVQAILARTTPGTVTDQLDALRAERDALAAQVDRLRGAPSAAPTAEPMPRWYVDLSELARDDSGAPDGVRAAAGEAVRYVDDVRVERDALRHAYGDLLAELRGVEHERDAALRDLETVREQGGRRFDEHTDPTNGG